MVGYRQSHQHDDEPENYAEVIGSNVLAEVFAAHNNWLAGSFSINGKLFNNFESNGVDNLLGQLNARSDETGVKAELTEDGHLKLSQPSLGPIQLKLGDPVIRVPPGERPPPPEYWPKNTILDDLGLPETKESDAEMRGRMADDARGVAHEAPEPAPQE